MSNRQREPRRASRKWSLARGTSRQAARMCRRLFMEPLEDRRVLSTTPAIWATEPSDGGSLVTVDANLAIQFSEPMVSAAQPQPKVEVIN